MAKRSDFAQKLLDDLRARKERMAAPAQSSNQSNLMAVDAYAYSKQTYKGSRETRNHGTISSRTGNSHNRSTGSRTPMVQEASNQIVAYGRSDSSGQIGDLSMAFAFAFQNGAGQFSRTDSSNKSSVLGFLNQFGRGSMHFRKMERKGTVNRNWGSSSPFPNLSNFHIEEISRGAQKLNQILTACSNGVKVDGFSIEIGKELFKGAIDLEESLRMLVNLQEASEYMTSSQRKTKITLLDDDEDGEENIEEQKQVALPRFSFDKTTINAHKIQEVGRKGPRPMMAPLTYSAGASKEENQRRTTASSVSRRHSVSYVPEIKNPSKLPEQKESKPDKERIPNVIAKLMGLDELPKNEKSKSTTTQKDISKEKGDKWAIEKMIQEGMSRNPSVKTKDVEKLVSPSIQKVAEGNKNAYMQKNTSFPVQAEKILPANNIGLEMVIHDGNQSWKDLTGIKPVTRSGKTTIIKTDKKQSSEVKQNSGKDNREYERKQDNIRHGEQKLQVRKHRGAGMIAKSTSNKELKQSYTNQAGINKKSMTDAANSVQSKGIPNRNYHENLVSIESSAHMKDFSQKDPGRERLGIPPVKEEKPVHHVAPLQKAKTRSANKSEIPRRVDEVVSRRNGTLSKLTGPLKQSILQEVKHRTREKLGGHNGEGKERANMLKQADPRIIKSNKSSASTPPLDLTQSMQKEAKGLILDGPKTDDFQRLKEPQILVSNDSCQNSVSAVPNDQQDQVPTFGANDCITVPNALNGTDKDSFELKRQKPLNRRKQEPLTESETQLKQIVIRSQLFLNTAEALFKLEIPFGILHASTGHKHSAQSEDYKLTLDCGYEVMKRKGRRQELAVHPKFAKISISFVKVESLDELVKELHKDFEKLRFYGRNGKVECEVEEYVPRMLEIDVNNREADVNCMWDLGWDMEVFGFVEVDEVVKDLERLVLNGLLDELTKDLSTLKYLRH